MSRIFWSLALAAVSHHLFAFPPTGSGSSPEAEASTVKIFPIAVVGGGSTALFTLFNFGDQPQVVSLSIVSDEGEVVFSGGSNLPAKATSTRNLEQTLDGNVDLSGPGRYWIRASSDGDFAAGGLQTLQVGGQSLLPYGVLASPVCRRMTLVLNETETLRGAVALANGGATPVTCQFQAYLGIQGSIASGQKEVPGLGLESFFLDEILNYASGFRGAVEIQCAQPVSGYSLLQDSVTGNTSAVSVDCADDSALP